MIHILSSRSLTKYFSLLAQPLRFSFSRSISVILVVFLVVIWRSKKSFPSQPCPSSRRFMVLASYHPLELFQFVRYSFLPIRSISGVDFCFASPEAIVLEEFFVLMFQLPLSNYPGDSVSFISHFWILMVVRSRFFLFDYHFNPFVLSILPVVHEDLLKFCAVTSQSFSRRISSMRNPLLVINLIWWRISIQ